MTPAKDFRQLAIKAVRKKMIATRWTRGTINASMSRIRRIFKHAIANELMNADYWVASYFCHSITCVIPKTRFGHFSYFETMLKQFL